MDSQEKNVKAEAFYEEALKTLIKSKVPFMLGGAFALREHTGIFRDTKDLDIFTKAGDYPTLLTVLQNEGYKTEITDARWIAKAFQKEHYIDIIFSQKNGATHVDDTWFEHAKAITFLGQKVQILPPEELIWSKAYIMDRTRFDGADINHIILTKGRELNWKRLLMRMEAHWEILLFHILSFRFVYPADRDIIPKWIIEELLKRVQEQLLVPTPQDKVCRGSLFSPTQYEIDIKEWGYKDVT
jgi:hypothetical protein